MQAGGTCTTSIIAVEKFAVGAASCVAMMVREKGTPRFCACRAVCAVQFGGLGAAKIRFRTDELSF